MASRVSARRRRARTARKPPLGSKRREESLILTLSDLHYGKRTPTFNTRVFLRRLGRLRDRLIRTVDLFRPRFHFSEIVLAVLGDVVDGDGIYPTHPHHTEPSNADLQTDRCSEALVGLVEALAESFPKVRVEAIPGNHGRVGRHAHEAANWDVGVYRLLRLKTAHLPNVRVYYTGWEDAAKTVRSGGRADVSNRTENLFLRTFEVRGHRYLLYHGHGVKMYQGIPWYGIQNRVLRWSTTEQLGGFEAVMMGHFHTTGFSVVNQIKTFLSGTLVSGDDFPLESLGFESANSWWLFGVSRKRAVTWHMDLDLLG
jgi:hypothetical protein